MNLFNIGLVLRLSDARHVLDYENDLKRILELGTWSCIFEVDVRSREESGLVISRVYGPHRVNAPGEEFEHNLSFSNRYVKICINRTALRGDCSGCFHD